MRKGYRKIVVNGANFEYFIGKSNVVIYSSTGAKMSAPFTAVTGQDWHNIERDQWKKNFSITPKQIASVIEEFGKWVAREGPSALHFGFGEPSP